MTIFFPPHLTHQQINDENLGEIGEDGINIEEFIKNMEKETTGSVDTLLLQNSQKAGMPVSRDFDLSNDLYGTIN